ncbi:MAG: GMC family oxidoreductase N-terminal domain-containing protein [Acidobacteriota bacterium]
MNRRRFLLSLGALPLAARARVTAAVQSDVDYIIVGAGSSGCVIANRLSADPSMRVLIVEAGPPGGDDPAITTPGRWVSLLGSAYDWKYQTEPEADLEGRRLAFPRGKVLGGSSAINAMTYVRGHRRDFDGWAAEGNAGWSYKDVLPLFTRSEDNSRGRSLYRGVGGPLAVSDCVDPHAGHEAFLNAVEDMGWSASETFEFNGERQDMTAGYYQKNIRDGRRHSAAAAFLVPVLSRPNLTALTGVQATRLIIEGTRCVGLEYLREGRVARARASRAVVLSAGVIDSPKLLMLSGIGPADHLRSFGIPVIADLRGVGANLQDHLKLSVRWRSRRTLPPSTVTAGLFAFAARGQMRDEPGAIPNLQFYVGRGSDQPEPFVTITASLVRPASRGSVLLRTSNPLDAPVIRGNYLREQADVDALVAGVRFARMLAMSRAFDDLRGEETEPGMTAVSAADLRAFARRAADSIYHPGGTCRMGTGPDAVVDAQLRVHGVEGLRVADASIMPTVVNATTHAACVMIGEKAADLLK